MAKEKQCTPRVPQMLFAHFRFSKAGVLNAVIQHEL